MIDHVLYRSCSLGISAAPGMHLYINLSCLHVNALVDIESRALLITFRTLLIDSRALFVEFRALLIKSGALFVESRALLIAFRALLIDSGTPSWGGYD